MSLKPTDALTKGPYELTINGRAHSIRPVLYDANLLTRVPMTCVPVNLPLPCPLYAKIGERFVMFRTQNDTISNLRINSFTSKGIDAVYVPKIFWSVLLESLENLHLPDDVPAEERMRHVRSLLMAYTGEISEKVEIPRAVMFHKVETLAGQIAEEIDRNPMIGLSLIKRTPDPTIYFVNHAINSGIYAALIGKSLRYPLEDLKRLVYGGFVHDIGNVYIPKNILYRKGKITPDELDMIKTHTQKGAQLLDSVGADPRVVLAAYQHHERVDGRGYPEGISGKEIHPFAKIIAISDVYDAITCNRPHQRGLSSQEAMQKMRSEEGLFDLDYLSRISFPKSR